MAGSFCADGNGNINPASSPSCPAGVVFVLDRNGSDSIGQVKNMPFTGIYQIDNTTSLGTMTITIPGLAITFNYNLAVSVVADSRFIQIDQNMYGSGVIRATTSISLPQPGTNNNGYSFGFFGNAAAGYRFAGAGSFISDQSGNVTSGVEDTNGNGTPSGPISFTSGALTAPPAGTPRGTITLNTGSNTVNYAFYVVVPT